MTTESGFTRRIVKPRFSIVTLGVATAVIGLVLVISTWRFRSQLAAATFHNPFPVVVVAKERLIPDAEAYKRTYAFDQNWFTWNIPVWKVVLAPFKGKPDVHYLEIGLYEGRSALWVLENILTHPSARLTGIDPFVGSYKEKYFANIVKSGSPQKITTLTGYSQVVLRSLPLNSFDIIYIDGSHAEDDVLEDAVLCSRLCKEGGILIFDDYQWAGFYEGGTDDSPTDFPKAAIDRFVQCFDRQFEVIHNSYQLILRKRQLGRTT